MNPRKRRAGSSVAQQGEAKARLVRSTLTGFPATESSGQTKVSESLRTLPELARQLVNADYGAVTVLDPDGHVTEMLYAGLTEEEAGRIGAPPKGVGLLGKLGEHGAPLRLDDLSAHHGSAGFPDNHPAMSALIGVRVTAGHNMTANLYVARNRGKDGFNSEDEQKVLALASYTAIALDNARLYQDEHGLRAAAEAAERRLAAVIQGSSAGVVVKDATNNHFLQVSGEANRISGITMTGGPDDDTRPFERLYHHPDGVPMRREEIPMNVALTQRVAVAPQEVLFVRDDGSRVPVVVSAAPVFDSYGKLDSAICVFVDVTRLKELERAKDDFLSMITHDLRTPLTTIKGMAAAALSAATDSDTASAIGYLEPIDDEVDYLTELVSNLLDMTRIEAGADVFEQEECHLADVAQDSLARISRSRDAVGRSIHLNVPPDLPLTYADPRQVGRVLDNLLSNALKYSDDAIRVTGRVDEEGDSIRIEVRDLGPGIPEGQQEAVFDRFSRLRGTGNSGRHGSGLGLAICRSIIQAHSGQIGVTPAPRGSIFWFTLPVDTGGGAE